MSRADCDLCDEQVTKLQEQIAILKATLIEERSAVLTCDICEGGYEVAAMNGNPTRVTDYRGEEDRRKLAKEQLSREMPQFNWEDMP